ncbi:hypothetical protein Drorol1_Dr00007422, partial [Drosera rotundifolia]
ADWETEVRLGSKAAQRPSIPSSFNESILAPKRFYPLLLMLRLMLGRDLDGGWFGVGLWVTVGLVVLRRGVVFEGSWRLLVCWSIVSASEGVAKMEAVSDELISVRLSVVYPV